MTWPAQFVNKPGTSTTSLRIRLFHKNQMACGRLLATPGDDLVYPSAEGCSLLVPSLENEGGLTVDIGSD